MRCARACRLRPRVPESGTAPALLLHEISDGDAEALRELLCSIGCTALAAFDCRNGYSGYTCAAG